MRGQNRSFMRENIETCPNCSMPNKGKHWSENLCYSALQQRIKELEDQITEQDKPMLAFLNKLIWDSKFQDKFKRDVKVINFMNGMLTHLIDSGDPLDDPIAESVSKEIGHRIIRILKEAGLWKYESQQAIDKQVAESLTKGS